MNRIKQYLKSYTINFGLLLQLTAVFQVYIDGYGNPLATMMVGMIVIGLRFKTTESLNDK